MPSISNSVPEVIIGGGGRGSRTAAKYSRSHNFISAIFACREILTKTKISNNPQTLD
jgi:hypothetical protein